MTLRLVLTPGEPAGIGPDLCVQIAQRPLPHQLVVIADPDLLAARARLLGLPLRLVPFDAEATPEPSPPGTLVVDPLPLRAEVTPGRTDPANAPWVLEMLARAVDGCLDGRWQGLVTGPVHKGVINEAGVPFSGHTEFLQQRCGAEQVVMLLATEGLRVALVTTHLPLRAVPDAITGERIIRIARILHRSLQTAFAIAAPRILVSGLNPHAGEDGHLGREELDIIMPALEQLRAEGLDLTGPLPADTLFTPPWLARADAVLAMYHDQGLAVLKHLGFGRAVNITLGLPIIRTSVDHGTALDLAGSGRADPGSLIAAIDTAATMVAASKEFRS